MQSEMETIMQQILCTFKQIVLYKLLLIIERVVSD